MLVCTRVCSMLDSFLSVCCGCVLSPSPMSWLSHFLFREGGLRPRIRLRFASVMAWGVLEGPLETVPHEWSLAPTQLFRRLRKQVPSNLPYKRRHKSHFDFPNVEGFCSFRRFITKIVPLTVRNFSRTGAGPPH